jgi:mRNA-degrading endonuclease RelE of RelBE toxin-antitoxin system
MTFNIEVSDKLSKALDKLAGKDPVLALAVEKKINQLRELTPEGIDHLKNLKGDKSHLKRVHVGSFVLLFQVRKDSLIFENFCHHDEAYH